MVFTDAAYVARFNRVADYIERNLATPLSLDQLAGVANFSKYHFHRLFQEHYGETLFQFVRRLRLERAASLLLANRSKPIIEIAFDCGFENASAFSRSFRGHFGVSATEWRRIGGTKSQAERMAAAGIDPHRNMTATWERYPLTTTFREGRRIWESDRQDGQRRVVTVRSFDTVDVAYVRHVGPYAADPGLFEKLFTELMNWAAAHDLVRFPMDTYCLVHDSSNVTAEHQLRISVCLAVPPGTQTGGAIGRLTLAAGTYAVLSQDVGPAEYGEAWSWAYSYWLPRSGYELADRPAFEHYHVAGSDPCDPSYQRVNICLPVQPAT